MHITAFSGPHTPLFWTVIWISGHLTAPVVTAAYLNFQDKLLLPLCVEMLCAQSESEHWCSPFPHFSLVCNGQIGSNNDVTDGLSLLLKPSWWGSWCAGHLQHPSCWVCSVQFCAKGARGEGRENESKSRRRECKRISLPLFFLFFFIWLFSEAQSWVFALKLI